MNDKNTFEVGDIVCLKSGGFSMTVSEIVNKTICQVVFESHTRIDDFDGNREGLVEANALRFNLIDSRCLVKLQNK